MTLLEGKWIEQGYKFDSKKYFYITHPGEIIENFVYGFLLLSKRVSFFRIVGFLLIFVVSLSLTLIDHLDLNSQIVIRSNA